VTTNDRIALESAATASLPLSLDWTSISEI